MIPASTPQSRTTVFVTHAAPDDNEFALWLSSKLAIAGYHVWVDRRRLRGGADAWDEIDAVLRNQAIKQIVVFTAHIGKARSQKRIGDRRRDAKEAWRSRLPHPDPQRRHCLRRRAPRIPACTHHQRASK